jgi:hypothetical protein
MAPGPHGVLWEGGGGSLQDLGDVVAALQQAAPGPAHRDGVRPGHQLAQLRVWHGFVAVHPHPLYYV